MTTRELKFDEWAAFFNAFSRRYRGQTVTVELLDKSSPNDRAAQVIARRVPLSGITAERRGNAIVDIEIMLGDGDNEHLVHIAHRPTKIRIAQVSNGADELVLIDTAAGQTTRIDFSPHGLDANALAETPGTAEVL
jgi:hypothetical protein